MKAPAFSDPQMARRKKRSDNDLQAKQIAGIGFMLFFGGIAVVATINRFFQLHPILASLMVMLLVAAAVFWVWHRVKTYPERERLAWAALHHAQAQAGPTPVAAAPQGWTDERIMERMRVIDWYQFEKLNAAILTNEGWAVERRGGAAPDGGVDLVAVKDGVTILVQCKHWRGWKVQEKVIREMLGSMTHFGVTVGAIHTLQGWTKPAAEFANGHGIDLVDEQGLSRRARASLTVDELARWLLDETHHCPKCEAEMVLRTGNFVAFWGCSRYPKCRGTLRKQSTQAAGELTGPFPCKASW